MDNTQLAELLMGIAKAQAAVIDAVERAEPGFRNNHAVPMLTTAANVRAAMPRIQDLPARILLRMQGRAAFDVAQIQQDLEAALASDGVSPGASAEPDANLSPAAIRAAARAPAANPAPAAAAPAASLDFGAKP
jgi:ParB-like chromosome segregation protein Spo0J